MKSSGGGSLTFNQALLKTMLSYIPENITGRILARPLPFSPKGTLTSAAVLYADIEGFTALTERLSTLKQAGAEELTRKVNSYFEKMLSIIEGYQGVLSKFGGDAVLVLFLGEKRNERAASVAYKIQEAMKEFKDFKIHLGLTSGEILLAEVGAQERRIEQLVSGEAVNRALAFEKEIEPKLHFEPMPAKAISLPEESQKIETLIIRLKPYLPEGLFEKIKADPFRPRVEAEHRLATVLFLNLEGLENMLETPEETTTLFNEYFLRVEKIVEKYGGTLDKVDAGEKFMILFGAPRAHTDDPERAVRAGMELLKMTEDFNKAFDVKFSPRCGVSTGSVFAVNVGSKDRKEYTVMGDIVNLAARVMGQAKEGELLAGQSTWAKVKTAGFEVEEMPEVELKGLKPVNLIKIKGEARVVEKEKIPLVNRASELDWFKKKLEAGPPKVLMIAGEPGIGKSRLFLEAVKLAEEKGYLVLKAACPSYGKSMLYLPWAEIIKQILKITEIPKQYAHFAPLLNDILPELKIEENEVTRSLGSEGRKSRLQDLMVHLLSALKGPLLLAFEDLHYMDQASLELLGKVLGSEKIIVLATYRPEEFTSPWKGRPNYEELNISGLNKEDCLTLAAKVGETIEAQKLPADVFEKILRTDGNPLFVKSILEAAASGVEEIPEEVKAVLLSRLDRLDEDAKEILEVASVFGTRFSHNLLEKVYPYPEDIKEPGRWLEDRIESLRKQGFIIIHSTSLEEGKPEFIWGFSHDLIAEVAYSSLASERKKNLHEKIGQTIEIEEKTDLLAYHYERSENQEKALEYLMKAGDKCKAAYANQEAIEFYKRALELAKEVGKRSEILEKMSDILSLIGKYDESISSYQEALKLVSQIQTPDRKYKIAELLRKTAIVYDKKANYSKAMEQLEAGLAVLGEEKECLEAGKLYEQIGWIYFRRNELNQCLDFSQKALKIFEEKEAESEMGDALYRLGVAYSVDRKYEEGNEYLQKSLAIKEKAKDISGMARCYNRLGANIMQQGVKDMALEYLYKALELYEKVGDPKGMAMLHKNIGVVYKRWYEWEEALQHFEKGLKISKAVGDFLEAAATYHVLGNVFLSKGEWEKAREYYTKWLHISKETRNLQSEADM